MPWPRVSYANLGLDVDLMVAGLGTVPGECADSAYLDRLDKEVYDYMEACEPNRGRSSLG